MDKTISGGMFSDTGNGLIQTLDLRAHLSDITHTEFIKFDCRMNGHAKELDRASIALYIIGENR